jgi:hypothetical protein
MSLPNPYNKVLIIVQAVHVFNLERSLWIILGLYLVELKRFR